MKALEKSWRSLFAVLMGTCLQGIMAIVWTSIYDSFVFYGVIWTPILYTVPSLTEKITGLAVWFSVELILALAIALGCVLVAQPRRKVSLVILMAGILTAGQVIAIAWGVWGSGSLWL